MFDPFEVFLESVGKGVFGLAYILHVAFLASDAIYEVVELARDSGWNYEASACGVTGYFASGDQVWTISASFGGADFFSIWL